MGALQILLIVLVVVAIICAILYFFGRRAQKRQEENQEQMDAMKQTIPMLVIDKKLMKLKDAGLPPVVLEKTPFYLRRSKVPIVKGKVGPKVMTFMCENKVFEILPVKKEIRAEVSGIYITGAKGMRGPLDIPAKPAKKKWFSRKSK